MSKYKSQHFLEISRKLFNLEISYKAKWLYVFMSELEHRYTNPQTRGNSQWFFRATKEILAESGLYKEIFYKVRKELIETGLLKMAYTHWVDKETKKKSRKKIRAYLLPDISESCGQESVSESCGQP